MQAFTLRPGSRAGGRPIAVGLVVHGSLLPCSYSFPDRPTLITALKDKPVLRIFPPSFVASSSRHANLDIIRTPSSRVSATTSNCSGAMVSKGSSKILTNYKWASLSFWLQLVLRVAASESYYFSEIDIGKVNHDVVLWAIVVGLSALILSITSAFRLTKRYEELQREVDGSPKVQAKSWGLLEDIDDDVFANTCGMAFTTVKICHRAFILGNYSRGFPGHHMVPVWLLLLLLADICCVASHLCECQYLIALKVQQPSGRMG